MTMAFINEIIFIKIEDLTKKNILLIHSFDARGKSLQEAVHWQDDIVLRSKAYFYYDTIPPALKIKNVSTENVGIYR